MNNITKLFIILSSTTLSACVNQNTIAQKKIAPVTSPCQKISALLKAYDTGFEQVKMTKIKAKTSNTWKAKYNLVGENCHIWSWGGENTTYACNISANDEKTAIGYYQAAINTTQKCLTNDWQVIEEPRSHDKGKKTTFNSTTSKASISAHFVPLDSVFSEKWTVYYYVGKPK
ncbi:MAG: hypothetical protein OQK09_04585 [Colwellia sp.]|nr:hypothetical protein [Colwellia sp.]MCW9080766.1 hypothetical protein [Colwellia sp.]